MRTKIGNSEVDIVSVEVQFGVRMSIDIIVRKTSEYGGKATYDVRELHTSFEEDHIDDMTNIGRQVYAQAIAVIENFEAREKE